MWEVLVSLPNVTYIMSITCRDARSALEANAYNFTR